jgi:hypothetical protein
MIRRLYAILTRPRLEPGDPHRYAPEPGWPGSCWCSAPRRAPVHWGAEG